MHAPQNIVEMCLLFPRGQRTASMVLYRLQIFLALWVIMSHQTIGSVQACVIEEAVKSDISNIRGSFCPRCMYNGVTLYKKIKFMIELAYVMSGNLTGHPFPDE